MTSEQRPAVEVWWMASDAATHGSVVYTPNANKRAAAVIEADREAVRAYWYRQGKDDGWQMCKENEIDRLREELAEAYIKLSGKSIHASDCATSNTPAMDPGPCNCDALGDEMTEITQADREMAAHVWTALDADQLDTASLQIFFARHRLEERAKIVAWLREQDGHGYDAMRADCIEAGEYLK